MSCLSEEAYLAMLFKILLLIFPLVFLGKAYGQVDPSSSFLLKSNTPSAQPEDDLESSRYTVRPGQKSNRVPDKVPVRPEPKIVEEKKKEIRSEESTASKESASDTPTSVAEKPTPLEVTGEMLLGNENRAFVQYLKLLSPEDVRRNILEISIAPLYFYDNSESDYWFRDYLSYGPGLGVTTKIWFSPFLGLEADFKTSLSTDIQANPAGTKNIAADHHWVDVGLRFRKFTSVNKNASQITFGLGAREYQMKIPTDEDNRVGVKTMGLRLSVEGKIPKSENYFWLGGVELLPKLTHSEIEAGKDIRSGSDNETNAIGFWFGGELRLSRKEILFWKFHHIFEKNLFGGQANTAEPDGNTPTGVVINHSQSLFQVGFTFGN